MNKLWVLLLVLFLVSCKDLAHEDEQNRGGLEWVEVALIGVDGNVYRLSCPVRSGGFFGGHNDGCYLKADKQ